MGGYYQNIENLVKPGSFFEGYFIQFVKAQSKNAWLHVHCRKGIGRITTFMVIYDIIKNAKKVSLEDIMALYIYVKVQIK